MDCGKCWQWYQRIQMNPRLLNLIKLIPNGHILVTNRPTWSQMVPHGPKRPKWSHMVPNGPNGPKWYQIISWSSMVPNCPNMSKFVPNSPKWSQMLLNAPKGSQMIPFSPKQTFWKKFAHAYNPGYTLFCITMCQEFHKIGKWCKKTQKNVVFIDLHSKSWLLQSFSFFACLLLLETLFYSSPKIKKMSKCTSQGSI